MDVTITIRHQDLDAPTKDYVEERMTKVVRLFDRLEAAQVIVDHEKELHTVEAKITAPKGALFTAKADHKDLRMAVDQVVHKLEAQVRQWKDRLVDHRHPPGDGAAH